MKVGVGAECLALPFGGWLDATAEAPLGRMDEGIKGGLGGGQVEQSGCRLRWVRYFGS